jgi:hypothetical protein
MSMMLETLIGALSWRVAVGLIAGITVLHWRPMSRPRAADDFKTIRTRIEELRQEKLAEQAVPATSERHGSSWPLCLVA